MRSKLPPADNELLLVSCLSAVPRSHMNLCSRERTTVMHRADPGSRRGCFAPMPPGCRQIAWSSLLRAERTAFRSEFAVGLAQRGACRALSRKSSHQGLESATFASEAEIDWQIVQHARVLLAHTDAFLTHTRRRFEPTHGVSSRRATHTTHTTHPSHHRPHTQQTTQHTQSYTTHTHTTHNNVNIPHTISTPHAQRTFQHTQSQHTRHDHINTSRTTHTHECSYMRTIDNRP